ncbi:MAG: hypothetical protein DHS20C06_08100 [Hyphobacterium sp.]|nr:MAG: hypothetical protein DHS20C06_08100 [Hyphobacterium sp.]
MKTFLIATTALATASAAFGIDGHGHTDDDTAAHNDGPVYVHTEDATDSETLGEFIVRLWDEADLDRAPYTDDHAWIEADVRSSDGVDLGEVERVRLDENGDVEAIVVEHGGFLEIGGHETLIERAYFSTAMMDDGPVVMLGVTAEAFEAAANFEEDDASDYPLSDDDMEDHSDSDNDPAGMQ